MAKSGKSTPKPISAPKSRPKTETRKVDAPPRNRLERPAPAEPGALQQKIFWGLSALVLVVMLALSQGVGINADDKFQNNYSTKLVSYYSTFGKDTAALNVPDGNMHLYGGFFEVVTGFANKAFGWEPADPVYHNLRHLFSAFFGWVAILCAALLARHIAGWRAGLIAMVILFLSPRFLGDAMVNPKDIPFAAGYIMALYNMVRVLDRLDKPERRHLAGLAAGLAIALATRAGGLLSFAYLGLFAGLHLVLTRGFGAAFEGKSLGRYALMIGGVAATGYVLAILFWPYALQSPLKNPFIALSKFSELEVKIRVLYDGVNVMSDKTPWHYPVKWILYTIPLASVAGFIGSLALLKRLMIKYNPLWVVMVLFAAIFPVAYIIYKDSVIHDGWRHLTFSYPPLAVAAALFWNELAEMFSAKKVFQYATYGAIAVLLADAAWFIGANPHYSYVYFNPLIGGVNGAYGKFETDYWGITTRQGIEWLEKEGILRKDMKEPVVIATNMFYGVQQLTAKYGDMVKLKYLKWEKRCDDAWDYALYPTRFIDGNTLQKGLWPPDNAVHIIKAGGAPILAVLKDNGKNCTLGFASLKLGDWQGAINYLQKEVEAVPDNDLAWANLAMAYQNNNQLEESKQAAEKALAISPDDVQACNLIGTYWLNKNDVMKAKAQFEQSLQREPSNPMAYYYLALIDQNSGNNQAALANLMKAIEIAPNFKAAYDLAARIYEVSGDPARAQQIRAVMQQMQ
jgi:Tfp pilus assembly protein PilF